MRWSDIRVRRSHGDTRITKLFLWWPLSIKGEKRWLETVFVKQVFWCFQNEESSVSWLHQSWATDQEYQNFLKHGSLPDYTCNLISTTHVTSQQHG